MKLWGGRFTKSTDNLVDEFCASIQFDHCLAEVDILGSLAHVKMLGKCGILQTEEVDKISEGLLSVAEKIKAGDVEFTIADEDIHMNIEKLLFAEIGELAGKLHTGRSRNDQVALDLHLYLRQQLLNMVEKIYNLQQVLLNKAKQHIDTILPGYTHLQRAEPVRFAHHLLAYVAMLQRDVARLCDSWPRVNTSPLGAGALAGSGFAVDRNYVAELLGFDAIYQNSMDAVSDRDFVIEFLSHAALIMMHLSRLSEELILWSSQEFGFVEIDDAYCTGSSMMPQKKNPDVAELARGKTGRVYGALMAILTTLKGLPLAYNKDMQEDKEGLFDTVKTLNNILTIYAPMLETMQVNQDAMQTAVTQDYSNATQLANYLVNKGATFRLAHEITGKIVLHCLQEKILLDQLALTDYQNFSPLFADDIYAAIHFEKVVDARCASGGTAREMVVAQIATVEQQLVGTKDWLEQKVVVL